LPGGDCKLVDREMREVVLDVVLGCPLSLSGPITLVGITPQFLAIEAERRMGLRVEVGDRGMPVWLTAVAALAQG
jgi:hypothetical protein